MNILAERSSQCTALVFCEWIIHLSRVTAGKIVFLMNFSPAMNTKLSVSQFLQNLNNHRPLLRSCDLYWPMRALHFRVYCVSKYWPSLNILCGYRTWLHTAHWVKASEFSQKWFFSNHLNGFFSISQQDKVFYALFVLQSKLRELRESRQSAESADGSPNV